MNKEESVFSYEKIKDLTVGDKDAIKHFTLLFVEHTVDNDLPQLGSYLELKSIEEAKELSHKMKASIDLFVIKDASQAIREIELSCTNESDIHTSTHAAFKTLSNTLLTVKKRMLADM